MSHADQPSRRQGWPRRAVLKGLSASGLATAATYLPEPAAGAAARPNVILVLVDDLAQGELGCYGNTFTETPHLDRLAADGVRFTDAYAAAPVCSPTRASLMTGQYPARVGITEYLGPSGDDFLPEGYRTLPSLLRGAGYRTGIVGKWHLTETYTGAYRDRPGNAYRHGFDQVIASEQQYIGDGDYFYPYSFLPQVRTGQPDEYLTHRLNAEAVAFVEAAAGAATPFFLYLSHYAVHTALAAPADRVAYYRDKPGAGTAGRNPTLAAMLETVDDGIGALRATLERLSVAGNTIIVVMSDNGGETAVTTNAPFRAGKGSLYEGGLRIPAIVRWPQTAGGRVLDTPINTIDLMPTLLGAAGIPLPAGQRVDGVDLRPLLRDGTPPARNTLYWVYPVHHKANLPQAAVRRGSYKLWQRLRDGHAELYDLASDPGETTDISAQRPAMTHELTAALAAHIEHTGILPPAPTATAYPTTVLAQEFDGGLDGIAVLAPAPQHTAGTVAVAGGALNVTAGAQTCFALMRSGRSVTDSAVAVVTRVRSFAGAAQNTVDTAFVGLVRDADNYALVWYNHHAGNTGWDVRVDGRLTTQRVENLNGTVLLPRTGSRLACVVHRDEIHCFAAPADGAWQFLFNADLGRYLRLDDPAVRAMYRYGFGARIGAGSLSFEHLTARRG